MRLDKILTIGEVAALAGWSRRRMLRRLQRLEALRGEKILVNTGTEARPRWTTTLGALERTAPEWVVDDETVEARLTACEERLAIVERIGSAVTARLSMLRAVG